MLDCLVLPDTVSEEIAPEKDETLDADLKDKVFTK